ncbi:MAG TPA: DsbA family protein [Burkholderiaceae bacterium]|nr:DsbA family protein [Burkholderiaceae bacterium]
MNQEMHYDLAVPVGVVENLTGAPDAAVTLVEYGDFECPTCKQTAPLLKHLLERFAGRLRLVFRHFPLEEVHPHALLAAEAAECAAAQGRFWAMHDLLFDNQAHLKAKQLASYAERLELDMTRYHAEIDDHVYLQRVREHIDGGQRSSVHATPGLFVNRKVVDVSFGPQGLIDAIERALHAR